MEGRFYGRDIIDKPSCPFCGGFIERPQELFIRRPTEMPVGQCSCGAVYACDVTGHNLGTAMIEALVVSCNGDWDLAFDLLPEEDYIEKHVEHYDIESHLIVHSGAYEGRQIHGALYFIRPQEDIREVTEAGTRRLIEKSRKPSKEKSPEKKDTKALSKRQVEELIKDFRISDLLDQAGQNTKILRYIQRLLYSVEPIISRRAAEALGMVSAVIAKNDPNLISRQLQGLLTAITDTAASSWGYIGAIGEIIRYNPTQFAGYLPELYRLMRDRALLPEALFALGRIAEKKPDTLRSKAFYFIPLLQETEPKILAYTVILLGNLKAEESLGDLMKLFDNNESIDLYKDGDLIGITIGELASVAVERINNVKTE
jgi:hypothetical protein